MNAKLAIAVVLVVGLGALYKFSDVFRTKVDNQISQLTEWTPENIADDPVGYLDFCQAETQAAAEALAQQHIGLTQKRGELESRRDDSQQRITLGDQAVADLVALWRAAEASGEWPVEYSGNQFDREELQRQIMSFDSDLKRHEKIVEACDTGLRRIEDRLAVVEESRSEAADTLADIESNRSLLEINELTDGTTEQFASLRDDVALVMQVADTGGESNLLSLDDLVAQAEDDVREQEFAAILSSRE